MSTLRYNLIAILANLMEADIDFFLHMRYNQITRLTNLMEIGTQNFFTHLDMY